MQFSNEAEALTSLRVRPGRATNTTFPRLCMCMRSHVMTCSMLTSVCHRVIPILEKVVLKTWHKVFHVKIPAAEKPIIPRVDAIWDQYWRSSLARSKKLHPNFSPMSWNASRPCAASKTRYVTRFTRHLTKLSKCSAEIHPEFRTTMEEKLKPMFDECLEIKGRPKPRSRDVSI